MKWLFLVLGALPFAAGFWLNDFMMSNPDTFPPMGLISAAILLVWGLLAFAAKGRKIKTRDVVVCLNLIAAIDLILVAVQNLLGAYWMNAVGVATQFFYLPLVWLGSRLTTWSSSMVVTYAVCFGLMLLVSYGGCRLRDKVRR